LKLTVIVWAAGQAAGLKSSLPPVLQPLAGCPALQFVMEAVHALEPSSLMVIGEDNEGLRQAAGIKVTYIIRSEQSNAVDVWQQAMPFAAGRAETVLILPGDAPLIRSATLHQMIEDHWAEEAVVTRLGTQDRILCFRDDWLWPNLSHLQDKAGDLQLAQLVVLALKQGGKVATSHLADPLEIITLDNRMNLAQVETEMRRRINLRWMLSGVSLIHPETTYIEASVEIGAGTVIWPNTLLQGQTRVGQGCNIGPGSVIRDSTIEDGCRVEMSVVEQAIMEEGSNVGPFGHLRKGAHLGPGAHMGNFGEVKNSYLGPDAKMGHFSYVGDATVGAEANIGAGTITCNYDGQRKHRTTIGKEAFIGSGTMLVAPVEVGERAKTGAGSVVTHDVPAGSVAYGVPARLKATPGAEESEAE
jgi:bifunctional UDP-N-acetylglucosamine pyrophosphorylase/glucosamine-1-phosphate N-acetyltransferase